MVIIECKKCREQKTENDFRLWRGKRNIWCIECRNKNNAWYATDKDGRKSKAKLYYQQRKNDVARYRSDLRLDRKYKLSRQEWAAMFTKQQGLCGICKKDMKHPCVDHDHETGKIRGLLHRECNLKLQSIEDKKFLEQAQNYLDSMK